MVKQVRRSSDRNCDAILSPPISFGVQTQGFGVESCIKHSMDPKKLQPCSSSRSASRVEVRIGLLTYTAQDRRAGSSSSGLVPLRPWHSWCTCRVNARHSPLSAAHADFDKRLDWGSGWKHISGAGRSVLVAKLPAVGIYVRKRPALDDLAVRQACKPSLSPDCLSLEGGVGAAILHQTGNHVSVRNSQLHIDSQAWARGAKCLDE